MSEPLLPYDQWIDGALRSVIRKAVTEAAENGLPGDHHFYVTFRTTAEGVELAPSLRAVHPEQMTIVLQHQFRDLKVDDDALSVILRFKGRSERLRVPFAAIIAFADPSVNFGLQFKLLSSADDEEPGALADRPEAAANGAGETEDDEPETASGQVIALDTFRKK